MEGLIEPGPQLARKYSIQGATSLVSPMRDGDVPFRILNPTAKPVTINPGTPLGAFTTLDGVRNPPSTETAPVGGDTKPPR